MEDKETETDKNYFKSTDTNTELITSIDQSI